MVDLTLRNHCDSGPCDKAKLRRLRDSLVIVQRTNAIIVLQLSVFRHGILCPSSANFPLNILSNTNKTRWPMRRWRKVSLSKFVCKFGHLYAKNCITLQCCAGVCRLHYLSRVVRKSFFCICENKDADQLRGNREADQRLCFRYMDSTIPLLPKSEISSL